MGELRDFPSRLPDEALEPEEAREVIHFAINESLGISSQLRRSMQEANLQTTDLLNVIRCGAVDPADTLLVEERWIYVIKTTRMAVRVALSSRTLAEIVGGWRTK